MSKKDLILDGSHTPSFTEIREYLHQPARDLWDQMNAFIQEKYQANPQITYSKCSGKPGWNVKYQKSGKSICTLYPEKEGFMALIVITLDLAEIIEGFQDLETQVLEIVKTARPFNGTKWLMLPVTGEAVLENVKQLLLLKQPPKK